MQWKSHFIFGFLLFLILGYFFLAQPFQELFILSIIAGFSALIPDLDHDLSKFRKWLDKLFPIFSFLMVFLYSGDWYLALIVTIFFSGIYFLFFTFLKPRHRGITHSLFALFLFSAVIYFFNPALSYAFFMGYFSHLAGDKTLKVL